MNFGERLKALRIAKGLTQQSLADAIGLSRATIAGYETKGKQPDFDKLKCLSNFFNVSIDYLLGHTNLKNSNDIKPYLPILNENNIIRNIFKQAYDYDTLRESLLGLKDSINFSDNSTKCELSKDEINKIAKELLDPDIIVSNMSEEEQLKFLEDILYDISIDNDTINVTLKMDDLSPSISQAKENEIKRFIPTLQNLSIEELKILNEINIQDLRTYITNVPSSKTTLSVNEKNNIAKDVATIIDKIESNQNTPLYSNGKELNSHDLDLFCNALKLALQTIKKE